jgi:hypothetical protein
MSAAAPAGRRQQAVLAWRECRLLMQAAALQLLSCAVAELAEAVQARLASSSRAEAVWARRLVSQGLRLVVSCVLVGEWQAGMVLELHII